MSSFENIVVVGNVGSAPETTRLESGSTVCRFSVATNRKYKDKEFTNWYTIEAWGKLGEICQQYVSKGDQVGITSDRLSTFAYIKENGEAGCTVQLTARDVRFLSSMAEAEQPTEVPW